MYTVDWDGKWPVKAHAQIKAEFTLEAILWCDAARGDKVKLTQLCRIRNALPRFIVTWNASRTALQM